MTITAADLFLPPRHPPGEDMAGVVGRAVLSRRAGELAFDDTGAPTTYATFNVPADTFIVDIIVNIATAFDATSPSVTIGDGDDADGFMDNTAVAPATAGWKSMKQDAQPYSGGKYYASADTIDVVFDNGTGGAAGSAFFYVLYIPRFSEKMETAR